MNFLSFEFWMNVKVYTFILCNPGNFPVIQKYGLIAFYKAIKLSNLLKDIWTTHQKVAFYILHAWWKHLFHSTIL